MSEPRKPALKGDGLIYGLERFQNWVADNWKFLAVLFVVAFVAAYGTQMMRNNAAMEQQGFWELAAKAKTMGEKEAFIASHPKSSAASIVAIQLTREQLDAAEFAKAEATASLFLQNNTEHPHRNLVLFLRGLAREELGKKSEALADVEKVMSDKNLAMLAMAAAERLK
jgi:predicted negative regulator of RcsB-dependent stress response